MSERLDLSPIADWLDERSAELHDRIVRRLGAAPEALPGRAQLALEAWALPVGIAAALVCALAGLTVSLQPETAPPASLSTLLSDVAEGASPRATDVYIVARRIGR